MSFWDSITEFVGDNAGNFLNAGVQLYGANQASSAASKAAKQQVASQQQAIQQQQPYAAIGKQAANALGGRMNAGQGGLLRDFRASDMQSDPGYQYRLAEGAKAMNQAAAAGGRRMSGGQAQDMSDYNQAMASQEYGRSYDRYNQNNMQDYNYLSGAMNAGQGASGQIGNYMSGIGNSQSAGTVAGNNAWNNAYSGAIRPFNQQRLAKVWT